MADRGSGVLDIEGLYWSTFRTKSYEDILKQFQEEKLQNHSISSTTTCLVGLEEEEEEVEEAGVEVEEGLLPADAVRLEAPLGLRGIVRDFMEIAGKADDFCCLLLGSIKRARADYAGLLRRVVAAACGEQHYGSSEGGGGATAAEQRRRMFTDLARVARLDNPLPRPELLLLESSSAGAADRGLCGPVLIPQLRSLMSRVAQGRRRSGFVGSCVKAVGAALLPAVTMWRGGRRRRRRDEEEGVATITPDVGARLEEAARGGYVVDEELQTVGRMLARVNEEVEHGRWVVRELLQGRPGRYPWREVVRLLQAEEGWLLEQLQELEQHAYLCLLTLNRARKALSQL